jgi:hypothetical protein
MISRSTFLKEAKRSSVLEREVGRNLYYKRLIAGARLDGSIDENQINSLLKESEFFSQNGGAYGPARIITFQGFGNLEIRDMVLSDDGKVSWTTSKGKYRITSMNPRIQISIQLGDKAEPKTFTLKPGNDPDYPEDLLLPVGGSESEGFSSSAGECDA